jgi:phosphatidylglycerol---prolipoprotein diacylglyceryl transferase
VYPVLFRIGSFEVTSFGVLVGVAALVGIWLFGKELRRNGLPHDAVDAAIAGVFGGLIGAKLLWTLEFSGQRSLTELLFSRGGLSWFGGLLGGVATGLWMLRRKRIPIVRALAAATPALAVGHAVGRIGCFLVGDDYGRPSNLPWAVAFPQGLPPTSVPVHPTQLYEAAALGIIVWMLIRWRRQGVDDRIVLGRYFILAGSIRFVIEFVRVNLQVLGPLTLAQLLSLALVIVGLWLTVSASRRGASTRRISAVLVLAALFAGCGPTGSETIELTEAQKVGSGKIDVVLLSHDGTLHSDKTVFTLEFRLWATGVSWTSDR